MGFEIDRNITSEQAYEDFCNAKYEHGLVYVASPYSGDIDSNVEFARRCCRFVYEYTNFTPIAPHLLFTQFLDDEVPRERATAVSWNRGIIRWMAFLLVFTSSGGEISAGMEEEIKYFQKFRNNIIYFYETD